MEKMDPDEYFLGDFAVSINKQLISTTTVSLLFFVMFCFFFSRSVDNDIRDEEKVGAKVTESKLLSADPSRPVKTPQNKGIQVNVAQLFKSSETGSTM